MGMTFESYCTGGGGGGGGTGGCCGRCGCCCRNMGAEFWLTLLACAFLLLLLVGRCW